MYVGETAANGASKSQPQLSTPAAGANTAASAVTHVPPIRPISWATACAVRLVAALPYRISSWGPPVFGCFYPDTRHRRCLLSPPHPYGAPLLLCLQPCFSPFEGGRRLPSEHLRKGRTPRLALAYPRSGAPLSREASAHTLAPMLRAPHPVLLRSGYYPPKRFGRAPHSIP